MDGPGGAGTHLFIARAALPPSVQVRAIVEEAIDPGHQIMHQKYIVRDASTPAAAVLMGSANFTTDAWASRTTTRWPPSAASSRRAARPRSTWRYRGN
jgi:hypothetical protein